MVLDFVGGLFCRAIRLGGFVEVLLRTYDLVSLAIG